MNTNIFISNSEAITQVNEGESIAIEVKKEELSDGSIGFTILLEGLDEASYKLNCANEIPSTAESVVCTFDFISDQIYQGPRNFQVYLKGSDKYRAYTLYDPSPPFLEIAESVKEGSVLTGVMNQAVEAPLLIQLSIVPVTATADSDYTVSNTQVTVSSTGDYNLPISIVAENIYETEETFKIIQSIIDPKNPGFTFAKESIVKIKDVTVITATMTTPGCSESVSVCTVRFNFSPAVPVPQLIQITSIEEASKDFGVDFMFIGKLYTLTANQTDLDVDIQITDDTLIESVNEFFSLRVLGLNFEVNGSGNMRSWIADNEPKPTVNLVTNTVTKNEGETLTVSWTLSSAMSFTSSFNVQVNATTGIYNGTDLSFSSSVPIPLNATSGSFDIDVSADGIRDANLNEVFEISIGTAADNLVVGTNKVNLTVTEGDAQPSLALTVVDADLKENEGGFRWTVQSDKQSELPISFHLQTNDGTAIGTNPMLTNDYQAINSDLAISALNTSVSGVIPTNTSDPACEANEGFDLVMSNVMGNTYTLTGATQTLNLTESKAIKISLTNAEFTKTDQTENLLNDIDEDHYYSGTAEENVPKLLNFALEEICSLPVKLKFEDYTLLDETILDTLRSNPSSYTIASSFVIPANTLSANYSLLLPARSPYQTPTDFSVKVSIDPDVGHADLSQVYLEDYLKAGTAPDYQGRIKFNLVDNNDVKPFARFVKMSGTATHEDPIANPEVQLEKAVQGDYLIKVDLDRVFEGRINLNLSYTGTAVAGKDFAFLSPSSFSFVSDGITPAVAQDFKFAIYDDEFEEGPVYFSVKANSGTNNQVDSASVFQFGIADDDDISTQLTKPLVFSSPTTTSGWVASLIENTRSGESKKNTGLQVFSRDGANYKLLSSPNSALKKYIFNYQFIPILEESGITTNYLMWSEGSLDSNDRPIAGSKIQSIKATSTLGQIQTLLSLNSPGRVIEKFDYVSGFLFYKNSEFINGIFQGKEVKKIAFPNNGSSSQSISCPGGAQVANDFLILETGKIVFVCTNTLQLGTMPSLSGLDEISRFSGKILQVYKLTSGTTNNIAVKYFCDALEKTICYSLIYDPLVSRGQSSALVATGEFYYSESAGRFFAKEKVGQITKLKWISISQASTNFSSVLDSDGVSQITLGKQGVFFTTQSGVPKTSWVKYLSYANLAQVPQKLGNQSCVGSGACQPTNISDFSLKQGTSGNDESVLVSLQKDADPEYDIFQIMTSSIGTWTSKLTSFSPMVSPTLGRLDKTFFIDSAGKLRETSNTAIDHCPSSAHYIAEKIFTDPKDSSIHWIKARDIVSVGSNKFRWLRFNGLTCLQLTEEN